MALGATDSVPASHTLTTWKSFAAALSSKERLCCGAEDLVAGQRDPLLCGQLASSKNHEEAVALGKETYCASGAVTQGGLKIRSPLQVAQLLLRQQGQAWSRYLG